jgi:murein DD-endopeptidase MepM/ murein hydrolase activator NlpD
MYQAATYAVFPSRSTTGFSPDDAGIGDLDDKTAVVVNPDAWGGGIEEFFDTHYPGTQYEPIEADNPFQLQGRLAAVVAKLRGVSLAYPTTHEPAVETSEFGVWRNTYYHNGCDLRSSAAQWGDRILAALPGEVMVAGVNPDEPWFGFQVRTRLQVGDMAVYIRYAHFVNEQLPVSVGDLVSVGDFIGRPDNTGQSTGDHLHIDVRLEIGDWWSYADPRLLFQAWPDSAPVIPPPLVGIHDEAGGEWMRQQGMTGLCLCHGNVTDAPAQIDMRHLSDSGIRVLYRLNHGYGGGAGTLPPPDQMADWVNVVAQTIQNARGVWGWIIANEMNNRAEWPDGQPITPQYYVQCYNEIWERVGGVARLTPAIDPYNAELMDPRDYIQYIYQNIHGLDFIALHGKTQGSEPQQVWSETTFTDPPLNRITISKILKASSG